MAIATKFHTSFFHYTTFSLIISLFFLGCNSFEEAPQQETRKRKRAEKETSKLDESKNRKSNVASQEEEKLPVLMPEVWQHIFSYLNFENVLMTRTVSSSWSELISGFNKPGVLGVQHKPNRINKSKNWTKERLIYF